MYGLGMLKGLGITMKNMVMPGRMFTVHQYPSRKIGILGLSKQAGSNPLSFVLKHPSEAARAFLGLATIVDRLPQHSRFRGEEFSWYEDRCTGCASCAKYCPLGIIKIVTHPSGEALDEGDKYAIDVFDIDIGRCMFCGLCVEACPYDAIHMGSGFEEGKYQREDLVVTVDQLRTAPKRPSTWFRPQLESKQYEPQSGMERSSSDVGRHERPTVDDQTQRWGKR